MKELEFIDIIKNTLTKNSHIGDDCAYLNELGIVVTQDSLVEDIHFSRKFATPYELGYKSIMVNLSDIFASGALPKYITVSLSLPKHIENDFVVDFYNAVNDLSKRFNFEVIGGDITGGDKCFISICAIGITKERNIASRKNAKIGDYVIATGNHGSSAAGLWILNKLNGKENSNGNTSILKSYSSIIEAHLKPIAQMDASNEIATIVKGNYAMMDTSDGLVDALFKVAESSNVLISVDFDMIQYDRNIEDIAKLAKIDFKDWVLYGGEDFQLIACVNEKFINKLENFKIIGRVIEKKEKHFVEVKFNDKIEKIVDLEKTYNHFGDEHEI